MLLASILLAGAAGSAVAYVVAYRNECWRSRT
jgi:hypothetical protein